MTQIRRPLLPLLACLSLALLGAGWSPALAGQQPTTPSGSSTINLGHVDIVGDPTLATRFNPCNLAGSPVTAAAPSLLSLDEAQQDVDFTILQPAWLPSSTYQLQWVQLLPGDRVSLYYRDAAADAKTAAGQGFSLDEQPWADAGGAFYVPTIPAAGTIGGQPAAFWTPPVIACQGSAPAIPSFQLAAWEDGDLLVQLSGMGLTIDRIEQIGVSLPGMS